MIAGSTFNRMLSLAAAGAGQAPSPPAPWRAFAEDAERVNGLIQRQLAQPAASGGDVLMELALAVAGVAIIWPVRLWLVGLVSRLLARLDQQEPSLGDAKAAAALVGTAIAIGLGIRLLRLAYGTAFHPIPELAMLANTAAISLTICGIGFALTKALQASNSTGDQPVHFPHNLGACARWYPLAGAAVLGSAGLIERSTVAIALSPASHTAAHIAVVLLDLSILIVFLVSAGRSRDQSGNVTLQARSAGLTVTTIGWAAILVGVLGLLLGYARFAALLLQDVIWSSIVGLVALLLVRFAAVLLGWLLGGEHAAGYFVAHVVGLGRERVDQLRILAVGLATLLLWSVAITFMLAPLAGGAGASLVDQIQPTLLIGALQGLHFSPRALAIAVAVFVIGLFLTRLLRQWMQDCFLPTTSLDVGIRGSIVTGMSYAGALVALLAAASALGIALDKVTLIASALSVGIGFGLQSIIQNFVSGIILLIERPIKVGDWVSASGAEGIVQRIRVRATEIAMPDGSVNIVPNSSFISAPVQNRTAAGIAGRIALSLKINGGSSPTDARDAILQAVETLDGIRSRPAPRLLLMELDDSSYGFSLEAYLNRQRSPAEAKSDLLYALSARLEAAGLKAALS